jgi:hypothetical protein
MTIKLPHLRIPANDKVVSTKFVEIGIYCLKIAKLSKTFILIMVSKFLVQSIMGTPLSD